MFKQIAIARASDLGFLCSNVVYVTSVCLEVGMYVAHVSELPLSLIVTEMDDRIVGIEPATQTQANSV